ncbi:MAG: hypothetical protein AAF298_03340 [Cyanobacteria bacterium P01_A01_bin.40]
MESLGFWEWFGIFVLFTIPVVNIIVFIAGACGVGKRGFVNYCRAFLLWIVVGVTLVLIYGWLSGGNFPELPAPASSDAY